jgi:hypothetical protein
MLIEPFAAGFLDELNERARTLPAAHHMYLLIDGAFVPGIHRRFVQDRKALLFEALPGCGDETRDVSPFLVPFVPDDAQFARTLRRCERWPMVSLIETTESLPELAARLAAWCVVEADGQRFNLRFPDTRRLPLMYQTFDKVQRAQFAGPAARWSYIARNGKWCELTIEGAVQEIASNPSLTDQQFAALVEDSQADETMANLAVWGYAVYERPSESHARISSAIATAKAANLPENELDAWCEWLWTRQEAVDYSNMDLALDQYRATSTQA